MSDDKPALSTGNGRMPINPSLHRELAIEANNSTWEILGRPIDEISNIEVEEMTRRAYAAAYHWQRAEGSAPANEARASWLLSRVWVVRNEGELALKHAHSCLAICESAHLVDFDLVFAHEALARSYACLGNEVQVRHHLAIARAISIANAHDRAVVEADLASEPWYGIGT